MTTLSAVPETATRLAIAHPFAHLRLFLPTKAERSRQPESVDKLLLPFYIQLTMEWFNTLFDNLTTKLENVIMT